MVGIDAIWDAIRGRVESLVHSVVQPMLDALERRIEIKGCRFGERVLKDHADALEKSDAN